MPSQYQEVLDALAFARTIIQPDWENGDGENPPIREWCKTVDALIAGHSLQFDLVAHLYRQRAFSERTFGPGSRTDGVLAHIRKELEEIKEKPDDVSEWVDVILLALDGAWRAGFSPEQIAQAIGDKQTKNEARSWPDWKTLPPDAAIEHVRTKELDWKVAKIESLHEQKRRLLSALEDAVSVAQAAHQHWAKGEDDKAAKYMMALAGELPGYDGRSDNVHKTGAEFSASEEADHA